MNMKTAIASMLSPSATTCLAADAVPKRGMADDRRVCYNLSMKRIVLIVGALIAAAGQAGGLENGGIWRDTGGVHINAHGGGLLREGDVWYWYGEHKVEGKAGNRAQVGVGCYSSKDLLV